MIWSNELFEHLIALFSWNHSHTLVEGIEKTLLIALINLIDLAIESPHQRALVKKLEHSQILRLALDWLKQPQY